MQKNKENNKIRLWAFRWFLVTLGWGTIILNQIFLMNGLHHDYGFFQALFHGLKLFTIQSNILVLMSLSFALVYRKKEKSHFLINPKVRTAFAVYITLTMLTFFIVLRQDYQTTGILHGIHLITHYIIPGGYLIDWFITVRGEYRWTDSLRWTIYPLIYGLFSLLYGRIVGDYAYPFLDIEELSRPQLAMNFILGVSAFFILSMLFIGLQKVRESQI